MAFIICPDCEASVTNLLMHRCPKSSGGGVESRHAVDPGAERIRPGLDGAAGGIGPMHAVPCTTVGVAPGPPEALLESSPEVERPALNGEVASAILASPARKLGRPRIGEIRDKPWETAGMSRTTWYRRQREVQPKEQA